MSDKLASKVDHNRKGYKASTSSSRNARRFNTTRNNLNKPPLKQIPGAPDYVNNAYRIAQITEWKEKRDMPVDVGAFRKAIKVLKNYGLPDYNYDTDSDSGTGNDSGSGLDMSLGTPRPRPRTNALSTPQSASSTDSNMSLDSDYIRRRQNDEARRERMDYAIRRGHVNIGRRRQLKKEASRSMQKDLKKYFEKKSWQGGGKYKTKKRKYKKRKTRTKKRKYHKKRKSRKNRKTKRRKRR